MMHGRRVAICAVSQTGFFESLWWKRFQEMAFDCVEEIVRETGVTWDERDGIRTVITCSDDVFDARTISDNAMTDAVGAHFRAEEKVAMDGINAIGYALAAILSGHDDVVLVVGHSKESQPGNVQVATNLTFDPFYQRPLGLDDLAAAALQARAYMRRSGITEDHLAHVVCQSRESAARNPFANARTRVSADEVRSSPLRADPLRALHCHPVSDGAVAILLAAEDRAARYTDRPVYVTGFASSMDHHFLGDRDLSRSAALERAAARAYAMAGVTDAAREIDLAEIDDLYVHQLPMALEELGLCARDAAPAFIDGGGLTHRRVNASGGSLAGCPMMIGGLARSAEAARQLRGEIGLARQAGACRAVAHGATGPAGQHQAVLVLETPR